jgi:hypothetical protein
MSDGQGGLTRRSGTSFAARWFRARWRCCMTAGLARQFPEESADIILRSAKDLGAPVSTRCTAGACWTSKPRSRRSASRTSSSTSTRTASSPNAPRRRCGRGHPDHLGGRRAFFTAFETIGGTKRDFLIPMSSRLVGQKSEHQRLEPSTSWSYIHRPFDGLDGRHGARSRASPPSSWPRPGQCGAWRSPPGCPQAPSRRACAGPGAPDTWPCAWPPTPPACSPSTAAVSAQAPWVVWVKPPASGMIA